MTIRVNAGWVDGLDPRAAMKAQRDILGQATRGGVAAAAEGLKNELRQQIAAAGLGTRLGNAIGTNVYPRQGGSVGAAGYVFPRGKKAVEIFDAFNSATTIHAKNGLWLAIPTRNAFLGGRGGHRPTPGEFEKATGIKLRLVAPRNSAKGRYQLLVGDSVAGRTGRRPATARRIAHGRAADSVVFFILVPSVRLGKRLSFDALAEKWASRVPDLIDAALPRGS
jgi:hypothetical protein